MKAIMRIIIILLMLVSAFAYMADQYADTHMHFEPTGQHHG